MLKNLGARIQPGGAADDNSEVVFCKSIFQAELAKTRRARTEIHRHGTHSSSTGHDRVSPCSQFEQVALVPFAAEWNEVPVGGGELAIRSGGDVDKDEWQATLRLPFCQS